MSTDAGRLTENISVLEEMKEQNYRYKGQEPLDHVKRSPWAVETLGQIGEHMEGGGLYLLYLLIFQEKSEMWVLIENLPNFKWLKLQKTKQLQQKQKHCVG